MSPPSPDQLEALSRLLDGELPADEATALRAAMDRDPELARAWQAMQALPGLLDGLPAALPGAPALSPPSEAAPPVAPPAAPRRLPGWLPWGVAAAAVLLALWPSPPPTATVSVPGATVALDGRAHLSTAESSMRPLPLAAAAAGGALLTVAVYEGSARVQPDDGSPAVTVHAGEERAVPLPAAAPAGPAPSPERPTLDPESTDDVATLRAELTRLQDENASLRLENALVRGSLTAHQGEAVPWPDDVAEGLRPDAFEAAVRTAVGDAEGMDLLAIDCDEFPCLAVMRSAASGGDWAERAQAVPQSLAEELGGEEPLSVMAMARGEVDDDGNEVMLSAFALLPSEGDPRAMGPRIDYRAEGLMEGLAEDARASGDGDAAP